MNLAQSVGYYKMTSINPMEEVDVEIFEAWVKQMGNIPEKLYEIQYQKYYKELAIDFVERFNKTKAEYLKSI